MLSRIETAMDAGILLVEVFSDAIYEEQEEEKSIKIHPLGYRWFRARVENEQF